ncbi:hypothetical protein Tco_0497542 [Tanacetum coccineum]
MEHNLDQPSPEHQPSSPRQESDIPQTQAPTHTYEAEIGHMSVDDLFQPVPQLMTRIESLEKDLKQTKQTMGNAIVKLVKKVKKMEKVVKSRQIIVLRLEAAETLAEALSQIKTKRRNVKTGVRRRLDAEDVSTGFEDVSTGFTKIASQREGKAILEETPQTKRTKKQIREEQASLAEIARIQVEEEAENARREELKRHDELAAKRLQEELELSEAQKKRMAQGGWKLAQIKKLIDEELKEKIEYNDEKHRKVLCLMDTGKRVGKELCKYIKQKSSKSSNRKPESAKSGTEEDVEAYMEEKVDEPSLEEFPMSSILQGPTPAKIVKWQIIKTGKRGAYQIIRDDNTDVVYVNFQGLLNDLTRDDLKELYRLMMLKYGDNRPKEEFERVLCGDLKTMFDPPSTKDAVWNLTHQQKVFSWRYFHSCAVHCLTLEVAHIYMLTEVKYPLPPRVCKAMLEKKILGNRKDEEDHNEGSQRNLKITSEVQVRGGLLGIIVNRLKSGSYRVKSGRHNKPIPNNAQGQNPIEPRNESNVKIEFSKELLTELQNNTFSRRCEEDVIGHIGKVLEILDLFKIAGVDPFQLRMRAFPLSLLKGAKECWMNEENGNISTWEELVKKFFKKFYPLSCARNYNKMCDDDEEGRDPLEFITWRNSKFKDQKEVDEATKRALLYI